jgi:peroxiredoxin
VVAVTVDPPEKTREHLAKIGLSFPFLIDQGAEVTRRYGVLHAGAGPAGADIPRPAELLIDPKGTIRWVELTEDYRVRARPETVLEAFDRLR